MDGFIQELSSISQDGKTSLLRKENISAAALDLMFAGKIFFFNFGIVSYFLFHTLMEIKDATMTHPPKFRAGTPGIFLSSEDNSLQCYVNFSCTSKHSQVLPQWAKGPSKFVS